MAHQDAWPGADRATESSTPSPAPARPREQRERSFVAELPVLVLIAFVLALLLKTFLVQAFYIPSGSMEPTLAIGDRVLVNKVLYQLREPQRGEVIVFSKDDVVAAAPEPNPVVRFLRSLMAGLGMTPPSEKDFIKRVIGLPGETIEQRDGVIYVDGEPLDEETVSEGGYVAARDPQNDFAPVRIPDGEYFVMGDNRPNSSDSRFSLGTIPREDVIGRAFVIIWPLPRADTLPGADYANVSETSSGDIPQLAWAA